MNAYTVAAELLGGIELNAMQLAQLRAIDHEYQQRLFDLGAGRSLDKKVIFVGAYAKTTRELQYLPADNPSGLARESARARFDDTPAPAGR